LGSCAYAARLVTLEDILKYKNITEVEVSPDGRRAAVVVSESDHDENTFRTNIHLVDSTGGAFKLTNGPRHDEKPKWSPDGKWIAFISDRQAKPEKAGKKQVWLISPSGGEAWQLTHERFDVESLAWSPDGRRLAVVATEGLSEDEEKRRKDKNDAIVVEQDLKFGRIYLVSVAEGNAELLYSSERHVGSISFSPKGDEIAFADQPTPKVPDSFNSIVRVIALQTKQVRVLAGGDTSNSDPKWSPDGRYLAFEGNSKSDWAANSFIYVVPAKGGTAQSITRDMDERVLEFDWAEDSSSVYFSVARGMDRHIFRAMLDGKIITVNDREGVSRELSVSRGMMAWVHETPPSLRRSILRPCGPRAARPSSASRL
jgi:Tol biopolymer transport system component